MTEKDIWRRDEVESPCVQVCVVHPRTQLCVGCFRTIDEIASWSRLDQETRAAIVAELPSREPLLTQRRGGRKARLDPKPS